MMGVCLLFFVAPLVVGASVQSDGRRAQALLEAGEPEQACAIYQNVIKKSLSSFERRVAVYNLGTAELAAGRLNAAREHFEQLVDQAQEDPVLLRRAHTNFAHTCLQLSQRMSREVAKAYTEVRDQCLRALVLLQAAAQACTLAQEQESVVSQGQTQSADLLALHSAIKEAANQWLEIREAAQRCGGLYAALSTLEERVGQEAHQLEEAARLKTPILSQIERLAERISGLWEIALTQATKDSPAMVRLEEAWSHFQRSQEHLQEGNSFRALENRIAAHLGVQAAVHAAASEQRSLEPLLENRCQVARRWERARSEQPYADCLGRIEGRYRLAARSLLREEKAGEPLADLLLERLALRMGREPAAAAEAVIRSDDDLWLYRQVTEPEEVDMALLCTELKRGVWPEQVVSRLAALREKVSARLELCKEPGLATRLQAVHDPLDSAMDLVAQSDRQDTRQLLQLVEAALCAWSPSAWLHGYLEDWQASCRRALAESSITPDFLDELVQEQRAVLETLEAGGMDVGIHARQAIADIEMAREPAMDRRAALCIQDAERALGWAIEDLKAKELPRPTSVLRQMIAEQEFARDLQVQGSSGIRGDSLKGDMIDMLCGAQERVLERAIPFSAALSMNESSANERILRLYEEGLEEAKRYEHHLRLEQPEWSQADLCQELAVEKWMKALRLLEDPNQHPDDPTNQGLSAGEPDAQDASTAQAPSELFDLLQRMEREDRSGRRKDPPLRRGIRPW